MTNKNNQEIPTKCYLCGIGIGVSLIDKKPYEHDQREPVVVQMRGFDILLCDDCFNSFRKIKDKEDYIRKCRLFGFI